MKQRIIRQAEGSIGPSSDSESYRMHSRRERSRDISIPQDRLERDFDLRRGRDLERAHHHIRRRKGEEGYLNHAEYFNVLTPLHFNPIVGYPTIGLIWRGV